MTTLNKQKLVGPRARREREKEQLRQTILDAAHELFLSEGYEKVQMRDIAKKIEYSPTTIYLYFKDKTELFFAICDQTFSKLSKKLESIHHQGGDPVEGLRRGCRAYVEFGLKYPNHYKVTFIKHPDLRLGKEHYLRKDLKGMETFDYMRRAVQACVEQNKMRETDVDAISQMLWAVMHGITALLITKPDFPWVKKDKLIDLTINSTIDGLLV
jgi:AcrR family transcriptional regulator